MGGLRVILPVHVVVHSQPSLYAVWGGSVFTVVDKGVVVIIFSITLTTPFIARITTKYVRFHDDGTEEQTCQRVRLLSQSSRDIAASQPTSFVCEFLFQ